MEIPPPPEKKDQKIGVKAADGRITNEVLKETGCKKLSGIE